jgi:hypothetical protein
MDERFYDSQPCGGNQLMAPATLVSVMQDYNTLITELIAERDRIKAVTDPTLPGGRMLWTALSPAIQTSLKNDIITNIHVAQTAIDNVVVGIGAL